MIQIHSLPHVSTFVLFVSQRGGQRPSIVGIIILCLLWLFVLISLFVAVGGKLSWLEFLQFFSYVKLAVTLIKYVPQVRVFWIEFSAREHAHWLQVTRAEPFYLLKSQSL